MKSENLQTLLNHGFNVPPFIVVSCAEDVDLSFSSSALFAVRSSCEAEDSREHSFAGQFSTFLNVERQDVEQAVEKVLSSANEGSRQYTSAFSLKNGGGVKVIVQEMVAAELSGVLFTANPQGLVSESVFVVGAGLGNGVVEDKTNTTTYYRNRFDGLFYYETQGNSPVISQSLVKLIFETGDRISDLLGYEADIEFAVFNGTLYILQARPITTLKATAKTVLDNSNISESYPGISLPATQSFAQQIYYRVFKSCVFMFTRSKKMAAKLDDVLRCMVQSANGQLYYRISNWYHLLKVLPFSKRIIPIWQEMLGVENKEIPEEDISVPLYIKGMVLLTSLAFLLTTPRKMKKLNRYFSERMSVYKSSVANAEDSAALLILYNTILDDLGEKWAITLINDLYCFVFTALAKKKHDVSINGIARLESLKPLLKLQALAELPKGSAEFAAAKADYIEQYGDRCLEELKLETKTMRTNPELFDTYLNAVSEQDDMLQSAETASERRIPWVARCAKLGISNREISRMNRSRIFGIGREIILKLAKIYTQHNIISAEEDIFWLYMDEIERYAEMAFDMREIVEERKAKYKAFESLPHYSRLVFSGEVYDKAPLNVNSTPFEALNNGKLCGIPCSSGIARGEVLVVTEPSPELDTRGKILVTKTTDPGWVFLIKNSIGVIAERGSLLSHTAIVTRELKKPAVVGVLGATTSLKTGDIVEINGTKGIITIVEDTYAACTL